MVFSIVVMAALVANYFRRFLPEQHLTADSRDTVKLGMGVIATLSALVLGMLVATAKSGFDSQTTLVQEMAANVMLLDRSLVRMGPQAADTRETLKKAVAISMQRMWPEGGGHTGHVDPADAKAPVEMLYDHISKFQPADDEQRAMKVRALEMTTELARERLRLVAQQDNPLSIPFLVVLIFWLVVLFGGYGLLAPRNPTVIIVLCISALSIAGALFLILELDSPFEGLMRVSSHPMQEALNSIGK